MDEDVSTGTTETVDGIDPEIAAGPASPKQRRGRKPGSTNKKTGKKFSVSPEELARQLQFIYGGVALMTGMPFWQLGDDEATMWSKSMINLAQEYDIDLFGGKTAALVAFLGATAMVNIPRLMTMNALRAQARRQAQEAEESDPNLSDTDGARARPSGVFDFRAVAGGAQ